MDPLMCLENEKDVAESLQCDEPLALAPTAVPLPSSVEPSAVDSPGQGAEVFAGQFDATGATGGRAGNGSSSAGATVPRAIEPYLEHGRVEGVGVGPGIDVEVGLGRPEKIPLGGGSLELEGPTANVISGRKQSGEICFGAKAQLGGAKFNHGDWGAGVSLGVGAEACVNPLTGSISLEGAGPFGFKANPKQAIEGLARAFEGSPTATKLPVSSGHPLGPGGAPGTETGPRRDDVGAEGAIERDRIVREMLRTKD